MSLSTGSSVASSRSSSLIGTKTKSTNVWHPFRILPSLIRQRMVNSHLFRVLGGQLCSPRPFAQRCWIRYVNTLVTGCSAYLLVFKLLLRITKVCLPILCCHGRLKEAYSLAQFDATETKSIACTETDLHLSVQI